MSAPLRKLAILALLPLAALVYFLGAYFFFYRVYIESGTDSTNFEDKPFKHVYCGEIIRVNKIRVVFRIFKYRDDILFSNPWVLCNI